MTQYFKYLASALIVSLLVACGGSPSQSSETQQPAGGEFKVGLLVSGPVKDQGWNQTAYDAFVRIQGELGSKMSYLELGQDQAAYEKAFRDYGTQGYAMVLGHGNEFQDSAVAVADDYPDTYFFISSSRYNGVQEGHPNVIGLNTDSSQPYYLFGVIAAMMGHGAGIVGGMNIPPIAETFTGFINGARSINPSFPVSTTYLGNFTDITAGKEAGLAMVAQGIDVLLPNADNAGNGIYQILGENHNLIGFGTYRPPALKDDFSICPDTCVSNYVLDYGEALVELAAEIKGGTFKPTSNIEYGVKDSTVMYITYNENALTPVPSDVRQAVDDAIGAISAGTVNTLEGNPLTKN
jgi:simple sugar transport system substrate-binding protein